ncbi:heat shock protein Hsp90 family [Suillus subluteus]|nr:heat shock protein Hsp90 family [Suillus subluteus]
MKLVNQHSGFLTTFPIYIWYEAKEEIPDVDEEVSNEQEGKPTDMDEEDVEKESASPKMKKVIVGHLEHLNSQPPLWMCDLKTVIDEEYELLYQGTSKNSLHGIISMATRNPEWLSMPLFMSPRIWTEEFFNKPLDNSAKDIRLLVKYVFITSDLGEYGLLKWASWVKVIIDADVLQLNVSRETLQSSSFLKQSHLIQLFSEIV